MVEDTEIKKPKNLKGLPNSAKIMAESYYKDYQQVESPDKKILLKEFYEIIFQSEEALILYNALTEKLYKDYEIMYFINNLYKQYERVINAKKNTRKEERKILDKYTQSLKNSIKCLEQSSLLEYYSDYPTANFVQPFLEKNWNVIPEGLTLPLFKRLLEYAEDINLKKEIPFKIKYPSKVKSDRFLFIYMFESRMKLMHPNCELPSKELYDLYMSLFPTNTDEDDMSYGAFTHFRNDNINA